VPRWTADEVEERTVLDTSAPWRLEDTLESFSVTCPVSEHSLENQTFALWIESLPDCIFEVAIASAMQG